MADDHWLPVTDWTATESREPDGYWRVRGRGPEGQLDCIGRTQLQARTEAAFMIGQMKAMARVAAAEAEVTDERHTTTDDQLRRVAKVGGAAWSSTNAEDPPELMPWQRDVLAKIQDGRPLRLVAPRRDPLGRLLVTLQAMLRRGG